MDPFTISLTSGYLSGLAATITANMLSEAGRGVRRAIDGDEAERALGRCVQAGVIAVTQCAIDQGPENTDHLESILDLFFNSPDAGGELSELLNGRMPDKDALTRLFEEAGYDPDTLPGIRFPEAVDAFAAAFLSAAVLEPTIQPVIQIHQLLEQTRIQEEMLETMREMAARLREHPNGRVTVRKGDRIQIEGGQIGVMGDHVRVGAINFYNGRPPAEDPKITQARRLYLKNLAAENSLLDALGMLNLRMSELEAGLYHAAFDAHAGHGDAEGTADIPEMTLLKGLKPYLGSFDKAELFVNYARARAGLLIRHKTDAYTCFWLRLFSPDRFTF